MTNETQVVPIWVIPGRVKAGEVLPLDATDEAIEAAAINAAFNAVECADDGDMDLVMPTARITVRPEHDEHWNLVGLRVEAWSQVAER